MKARTADWEPSLHLSDLKPENHTDNDDDGDGDASNHPAFMVTYSTFNPGATRLLPLSNILSLSGTSGKGKDASEETPSTGGDSQVGSQLDDSSVRPWPYSLPAPLRPQSGTTFDREYGGGFAGDGTVVKVKGEVKVGLLRRVLYGVPDPESGVRGDERAGGVLH